MQTQAQVRATLRKLRDSIAAFDGALIHLSCAQIDPPEGWTCADVTTPRVLDFDGTSVLVLPTTMWTDGEQAWLGFKSLFPGYTESWQTNDGARAVFVLNQALRLMGDRPSRGPFVLSVASVLTTALLWKFRTLG